jgi:hypothetical protein
MAIQINRQKQYEILALLKDAYPGLLSISKMKYNDKEGLKATLYYLSEHRLIEIKTRDYQNQRSSPEIMHARITAQGIDFLEDDGGISAILQTVTVKFDAQNIRTILKEKIIASQLSEPEKQTLIQKLKGLSGNILQDVLTDTIKKGLERPELLLLFVDLLSKL